MDNFFPIILSGITVAAASGLVGSFLVLRRMTLLSDALSHVALPGIALGVLWNFEPLLGGIAFLFLAVLLIWGIENKTKLAIESITGVLFVTALAVGALLIPEHELLEAFFGSVENISTREAILQALIAIVIIGTTIKNRKALILYSIAPELSAAEQISKKKMELLLLTLIALTIAIGVSFVGILLMSALSIIPAVTARNLSNTLNSFLGLSVIIAIASLLLGLVGGQIFDTNPGIATVLISAAFFFLSLLKTKN